MRYTLFLVGLTGLLFQAGCGDSDKTAADDDRPKHGQSVENEEQVTPLELADSPYEAALIESLSTMQEVNKVLAQVKDLASAKAAVPELQTLGERIKTIESRVQEQGEMTDDQKKVLEEKYKGQMGDVVKKLMGNMARISLLGEAVQAELAKVEGLMGASSVSTTPE